MLKAQFFSLGKFLFNLYVCGKSGESVSEQPNSELVEPGALNVRKGRAIRVIIRSPPTLRALHAESGSSPAALDT